MENNSLAHWGIKGMRWGVRRYQNPDGSLTPAGKKRYADDAEDISTLSDAELRARINRIQMERQYSQLTAKEKSAGRKFVESLLTESGKEIAKKYIVKMAVGAIDAGLSKGAEKNTKFGSFAKALKLVEEKKK